MRDEVEFGGYLFHKWAGHPGQEPDAWGEALDTAGILAQARKSVDGYGVTALKLKGGVFEPEVEAATIEALRAAVPETPLRIDLNGAWTVETAIKVGRRLAPVLEYLEDPCLSIAANAAVRCARKPISPSPPTCAWSRSSTSRRPSPPVPWMLLSQTITSGRAASLTSLGRNCRDVRAGSFHTFEFAPGFQLRRDDPAGRHHQEHRLRLRHPLALEIAVNINGYPEDLALSNTLGR